MSTITAEQLQEVMGWIAAKVAETAARARPVASVGFRRLPLYFTRETLARAKYVLVDRIPVPPLSEMGLSHLAAFENGDYGGITYGDTYFLMRQREAEERLHFHELIHVVQYGALGFDRFLAAYASGIEDFGYRDSPLERMAYNAEEEFVGSAALFDAEKRVANELNKAGLL